jgi:hypothetical protein
MTLRERGIRVLSAVAMCAAAAGAASAETGVVSGSVTLPDPAVRSEPLPRNQGFLARIKNPILPPRKFDPTPWLIVVLEPKGKLADDEAAPPKVPTRYELVGEAFAGEVFPGTVGGEVAIKNGGLDTRRLVAPDLLQGDPINPGGDRIVKLTKPYVVTEIRDPESVHLVGRVVAFPLRYHAKVAPDGSFEIRDVPEGEWTLRVWYRNGWLKMKSESVSVSKRETKLSLRIPDVLTAEPPAGGAE